MKKVLLLTISIFLISIAHAAFAYAELASSGRINGIKDYQNAAPAYEMAALADIPEACKKAGEYYLKGLGVVRDLEKALDYYLKASLLGDNESTIMVNIIKKQIDLINTRPQHSWCHFFKKSFNPF